MKRLLGVVALLAATAASAQTTTTNCQFVLGTMQCTSTTPQQQQNQINWGLAVPQQQPNAGQSFMEAFERGRRLRQEQELARQQSELLEQQTIAAQREAEAVEAQRQTLEAGNAAVLAEIEQHKQQSWEAAKMVTAGDCAGAEAYAVGVANFVLAKQIKDYCGAAGK